MDAVGLSTNITYIFPEILKKSLKYIIKKFLNILKNPLNVSYFGREMHRIRISEAEIFKLCCNGKSWRWSFRPIFDICFFRDFRDMEYIFRVGNRWTVLFLA